MRSKTKIKKLIKNCKKQEWSAQKELYLLFADDMMSIAIRYSKDLSSAKDLVQETFLTFFKKIDQYDENKGALGALLSKILINNSFVEYRKNQRIIFTGEEVFLDQFSNETSVIETLEAEDILNLLQKLPHGCRIIFNLKVIEGYSHNEIGELLEITPSASRSQLTRAKKLLRDMINKSSSIEKRINPNYKSKRV
ncbi:MAG: RNA polymerase sigma factor [Saprospiraceae bacterium]